MTESGFIQIIYAGRKSGDKGCDFQDAVFCINGINNVGDVEIHTSTKQWYKHKHHLDPAYVRVALHVVMWEDHGVKTIDIRGRVIPTICLSQFLKEVYSDQYNVEIGLGDNVVNRCRKLNQNVKRSRLLSSLVKYGELRFLNKTRTIELTLKTHSAEQVIYQFLARALGYSRNSTAFEELANRLPVENLKAKSIIIDAKVIKAMLIGTAGLLPSQREGQKYERYIDDEEVILENIWAKKYRGHSLVKHPWVFYHVRPQNLPLRRLVALGMLIYKMRFKELHMALVDLIRLAYEARKFEIITDGIEIADEEYWNGHFDFGLKLNRKCAVLGHAKASEIIINTILPFIYVHGMATADNYLEDISMQLYMVYPALEDNYITRYMQALFFGERGIHLNAVMQQGLIYIFQHYCRYKHCLNCPISNLQRTDLALHPG